MRNSTASTVPAEMLPTDRPSAPAPIRYPVSVLRYPLMRLAKRAPKPKQDTARTTPVRARLRRMNRSAYTLMWWLPLWYVLGQLVLLLWIDESWALTRTRVERDKWRQLHARLAETPDRPLVLMLGSSRSDWAFQAGRLNGQRGPDGRTLLAYNLGVPTTGSIHEALYLNDLLAEGIRPRLLLIEFVSTHLNASQRDVLSEEHFTIPQWLSAHQVLFFRRYYTNQRRMLIRWVESRLAPWYGHRCDVHDHLQGQHSLSNPYNQQERPMDASGWRMLFDDHNSPQFRKQQWAFATRMYGRSLGQFRLGRGPVQALRDVLARCRREGIPTALVRMPVSKEFRKLYTAQARADLDQLFEELRKDVPVIDASEWLAREDFEDGHHVCRTGADKYTTRMIDEVQKLLIQTEPPRQPPASP